MAREFTTEIKKMMEYAKPSLTTEYGEIFDVFTIKDESNQFADLWNDSLKSIKSPECATRFNINNGTSNYTFDLITSRTNHITGMRIFKKK